MKYNQKKTIKDLNLNQKTVVVRLDLNVPIVNGIITDDTRIIESLETLKYLVNNKCKIVVLSHLGRIKSLDDITSKKKSLAPVALRLGELIKTPVHFCSQNVGDVVVSAVNKLKMGEILVLENTRYQDVNEKNEAVKHESKNDLNLAKFWANLGTVFINDAFGTAHRAHASNVGVAFYAKDSGVGFLIERELVNLAKITENPKKPFVAVLGGAKIADKLKVINSIVKKADYLIIGGGMAYTFLKALNYSIGDSMVDDSMVLTCSQLIKDYKQKIILPVDIVVGNEFKDFLGTVLDVQADPILWEHKMGMDVGPKTIDLFDKILTEAKTVIWNGPVGVFEFSHYQAGTKAIADKIKEITTKNNAFTLIGGGDSASAYHQFNGKTGVSFISTGGGASLAYIEDTPLPGIVAIADKN